MILSNEVCKIGSGDNDLSMMPICMTQQNRNPHKGQEEFKENKKG